MTDVCLSYMKRRTGLFPNVGGLLNNSAGETVEQQGDNEQQQHSKQTMRLDEISAQSFKPFSPLLRGGTPIFVFVHCKALVSVDLLEQKLKKKFFRKDTNKQVRWAEVPCSLTFRTFNFTHLHQPL